MCANSEGSGETARKRRVAWVFAGRLCDEYPNLMSLLRQIEHKSGTTAGVQYLVYVDPLFNCGKMKMNM